MEGQVSVLTRQLFDPATSTYTYLVVDELSHKAALIDPVREQLERDLQLIGELGVTLELVLETHVHADHVTSAGAIVDRTGARAAVSEQGAKCASLRLHGGDTLQLGALQIRAIATPGHTPDSLSFLIEGNLFSGDSLLVRGTGRTDFQGGDAGALYDAITQRLFTLPDDTRVWPGHDYRGLTATTIGEEKRHNPRLAGKTRDQFVAIMRELNLAPPKQMQVAVPANLACGRELDRSC